MSEAAAAPQRRLIVCADDYGLAPGVNAAIRDLIAAGRLNATSVMVVTPHCDAAAAEQLTRLNAERPRVAIGLHLTLTAPFAPSAPAFKPLRNGRFLPIGRMMAAAFARRIAPAPLRAEIAAQFASFARLFGRPPDFVDGHQHVHLLPQVREALLEAMAARAPGAWVRQCGQIRTRLADPKGLLIDQLSRRFRRLAAAGGIGTNPAFAGTYSYRPDADFAALFPRFLDGLPDSGLVMCHPGRVDAELTRLDPLTDLREAEYRYLAGPDFPRLLAERGFTLVPPG